MRDETPDDARPPGRAGSPSAARPADDEEAWATRHGTFAPGVGADGRAPRGPRREPESPSELFARTRKIPGGDVTTTPGYYSLTTLAQWSLAVPILLALDAVFGFRLEGSINPMFYLWLSACAVGLVHAGLLAYEGIPRAARWGATALATAWVVAWAWSDYQGAS